MISDFRLRISDWGRVAVTVLVGMTVVTGTAPARSEGRSASLAIAALESASEFKEVEAVCIGGTPVSLSTRLKRLESVEVKTQDQSYEALTKQGITKAQVSPGDSAALRKAAEAAGVDYLLAGSLTTTGNLREPGTKVRIAMKLFTTASGEVKEAGAVEGTAGDLSSLQAKLAGQVLQALQTRGVTVSAAEQADILHEDKVPLEAYLSFSEGNRLYFEGKYAEAELLFWEAYQKSGGAFHAALAQYEKAGEKALTKMKEQGEDISLDRKKRREVLKKLDEEQTERLATVKFVRAEFSRWEAGLVAKEGQAEEARSLYKEAVGYYEAFLANTRHQLLKWRTQIGLPKGWASSSPVVENGRLFVGSTDGHVYALDISTGGVVWKYRPDGFTGVVTWWPMAGEERVYVGIEGALYALDVRTGRPRWRFYTSGYPSAEAEALGGSVLVSSTGGWLYCINGRTGVEQWRFQLGGGSGRTSVVADAATAYVGDPSGKVHAVDVATGRKRWDVNVGSLPWFWAPSLADNRLCVATDGKGVFAVDTKGGSICWQYPLKELGGIPVVSEQRVFVDSSDGHLHAIDLKSGRELWDLRTGSMSGLAARDGRVYFGSLDGKAYVVDAQTGKVLAALEAGREIATVPAVHGDTLYVHALDGRVCAFNLAATGGQPVDVDAWCGLARAQAALANYSKAQEAYSAVLDRRPSYDVSVYAELAECWRHLGNAGNEMKAWTSWLSRVEEQPAEGMRAVQRLRDLVGLKWVRRVSGVQLGPRSMLDGQLYVGSAEGITALDAETGAITWQHPTGASVSWPPMAAAGAVCVEVGERELRILDVGTGDLKWRTELPTTPVFKAGMISIYELCFDGRNVCFASVADDKGEVTVLDAATGERRWSARPGSRYLCLGLTQSHVFVGGEDGRLRALDTESGRESWSAEVGSYCLAAADADILYCFPYDQPCVALDRKTGQRRWQSLAVPRWWWFGYDEIALPLRGTLYLGDMRGSAARGDTSGTLHCLDAGTGEEKWLFETPDFLECTPAPDGNTVYFTSRDSWLRVVDAQTGRLRWALPDCGGSHINPLRHGDSLIVTAGRNLLWSLDLRRVEKLVGDGVRWWEPNWREPLSYARSTKDIEDKKKHLTEAEELAESDPEGLARIARMWLELEDIPRADELSGKALALNPGHEEAAKVKRGTDLLVQELEAVKENPDDPGCVCTLAGGYASKQMLAKAEQTYQQALQRWPDEAEVHFSYAEHLSDRKRDDEAITHYRKAFQKGLLKACMPLAGLLIDKGNAPEALEVARKAVDTVGVHSEMAFGVASSLFFELDKGIASLARSYQACGKSTDALREYLSLFSWLDEARRKQYADSGVGKDFRELLDQLREQEKDRADRQRDLGFGFLCLGDRDLARTHAEALERLRPNDPDAALVLSRVDWETGNHGGAVERLQAAFKQAPDRFDFAFTLAGWLQEEKKTSEALQVLRGVAARAGDDFELHGRLGRELMDLGDYESARDQADIMEKLLPKNSASVWLLEEINTGEGKPSQRARQRALFLDICKNVSAYRVEVAEEQIGRALAQDPDNGMLHYLQAHLYVVQGRHAEAVAAWEQGNASATYEIYATETGGAKWQTILPHQALFRAAVRQFGAEAHAMELDVAVTGLQAARGMGMRMFDTEPRFIIAMQNGIALSGLADTALTRLLEGKPEHRQLAEMARRQYERDTVWGLGVKAQVRRYVAEQKRGEALRLVELQRKVYGNRPLPFAFHHTTWFRTGMSLAPEVSARFDREADESCQQEAAFVGRLKPTAPKPDPILQALRAMRQKQAG